MSMSASRTSTEEYYVYDFIGMVGTAGGSCGLFLGFSFFDAFCKIFDFLNENSSSIMKNFWKV